MKVSSVIYATILTQLFNQVFAGTMGESSNTSIPFISISGGPFWANAGQTQTFFLAPDIEKTYVNQSTNTTNGIGELFIGLQQQLSTHCTAQFGVAGAFTGNVKLRGLIWDDAEPQFDNHSYRYNISHSRVTAKGKLIVEKGYWIMPYVGGSVGAGFNRAHHYYNIPLIPEALPNENFKNHTKTTFTYTVNIGAQTPLNLHWQLGVGYEFADWGRSTLGTAIGQTLNSGISTDHLFTHGLLVSLTYLV